MSVRIHIDRLVVDRALTGDPAAYAEAISAAIARQAKSVEPSGSHTIESLNAGGGPAGPDAVAGRVAGALTGAGL